MIKKIGIAILERRQSLQITQQELADLAGVGINTLVAIERGTGNPSLKTLIKVADCLGLELNIGLKKLGAFQYKK